MLHELLHTVVKESGNVTDGGAAGAGVFTSTGDKYILTATAPLRLLKWGFLVTNTAVAQTSSAMAFELDLRPTAGSDSNRVSMDTLTTVASSSFALGTGGFRETFTASTQATTPASEVANAGPIGNTQYLYSGQQQITLSVGQQLVIKVATASDNTGQGKLFFEYVLLPINKPSGYTLPSGETDVSLTDNYTAFAS